jgi:hypothetical protein
MNLTDFLYETKNGRRRVKPRLLMLGVVSVFVIFIFILLAQHQAAQTRKGSGPFVTRQAAPPRNLDYQIVKVDTIPFSHLNMPSAAAPASQRANEQVITARPAPEGNVASRARATTNAEPAPIGGNSNMIVVSNLDQQGQAGTLLNSYAGLQSTRIKVILPQRTPVMNGSLVEVRVMKDERLGKLDIPRRSPLLGFCTLQNNRVQIDFRELRIKDVTHTCSGRAFDLKLLPGIAYLPLDAKAKQVLVDELKSAASGVPILGRYLNQSEINPFTDEITTLEEGLEFYVVINTIF